MRVPMYTYSQLERMSGHGPRCGIKLAAADLRDQCHLAIGEEATPYVNIHAQQDEIIKWMLGVQVQLAHMSGMTHVTINNFGVPNEFDQSGRNHSQRSAV